MRSHLFIASAAAIALPRDTPPQGYNKTMPLSNAEFGLSMMIPGSNGTYAELSALWWKRPYEMVLGHIPAADNFQVTPAYIVNDEPEDSNGFDYVSLKLDVDGIPWNLSAADIGDLRGAQSIVLASSGPGSFDDNRWLVSTDGSVNHELKAANNMFMACRQLGDPMFGDETYVLSWGSAFFNMSLPEGCGFTSVRVDCNVPGSQYPLCTAG